MIKEKTKDKIINFRYIFYPFLAFLLGIIVARRLFGGNAEIIIFVTLLIMILGGILIYLKKYKPLIFLLAFFILGNVFFYIGEATYYVKDYSGVASVTGRVTDNIDINGYYVNVTL